MKKTQFSRNKKVFFLLHLSGAVYARSIRIRTYFQEFVTTIFASHTNQKIGTFVANDVRFVQTTHLLQFFSFFWHFHDFFYFKLLILFFSCNCLQSELRFWSLDVTHNSSKTSQNKSCEKWPNMYQSDQESIF